MESVTYLNTHCCDRKKPLTLFEYAFFVFTCYRPVFLLPFCFLVSLRFTNLVVVMGLTQISNFRFNALSIVCVQWIFFHFDVFPLFFIVYLFYFFFCFEQIWALNDFHCATLATLLHRAVAQTFVKLSTEKSGKWKSAGPTNLFIDIKTIQDLFEVLCKQTRQAL